MTTSLLLILLATSPFATSSECHAHFDGDGIEWDGPEVCAASQSRFLQTTDFIKAVPATIQVEMLYNATGSDTTEIDLLLTNTGSGVEVVEFIDLGRDLNVMELQQSTSAVPELSPLVNRPSRVAATEGFTRGQDRDGSGSRRITFE
ncbi:hypothetical protein Pmar_PMAR013281 [Perkinsus marinus ATCC 50983]|uniref:Uncharacterized protein n=1 Tax=Perkinsus marinus (strain ATCC 50983 / TXsc) TaxID=423536 RepID=C5LEY8_PERM5|nr:hypothetical protein Pmar_PMAR013281 [Perkinsus marinus ATCC 50983]EER04754.1 hypothetical protein Pmar_PMAR013281 [Perkinsus marinus ATCC 50983]|eukprot:XP_002772938.1 hypothetical protein Pmar_PMAR013281 [Perkinsus marinus ATCC 50983]